jgi:hypothetical protein
MCPSLARFNIGHVLQDVSSVLFVGRTGGVSRWGWGAIGARVDWEDEICIPKNRRELDGFEGLIPG